MIMDCGLFMHTILYFSPVLVTGIFGTALYVFLYERERKKNKKWWERNDD